MPLDCTQASSMPFHSPPDSQGGQAEEFFRCVGAIFHGDEQSLLPGLQRRLMDPPVAMINAVLSRELSKQQVQRLLFCPTADDMRLYPALLAGDAAQPDDLAASPANKAQAIALAHLWLVHGRCWDRLRPFLEAGGLGPLAALVCHRNATLASQALQLLIQATHPDMHDWNAPPGWAPCATPGSATAAHGASPTASDLVQCRAESRGVQQPADNTDSNGSAGGRQHPALGPDGRLWQQLAGLQSGPLLAGLLALSPDRFPGSGHQALQLMAFLLTWLRAWWSKDGVLQLSPALLSGLAGWSVRSSATAEERQLAAQLLADFAAAGPAPAAAAGLGAGAASSPSGTAAGAVDVACEPEPELRVLAAKTQVMGGPGSEAARLKAAGNTAFRARDWATAIQAYSAALDVPVPAAALLGEGPRRAAYHTNRAAAYLERAKELQAAAAAGGGGSSCSGSAGWREVGGALDGLQLDGGPDSISRQLQAAVLDCRAALELQPSHAKAHYRLSTALRAQGHLSQALTAARSAEHHAAAAADKAAAARLAGEIEKQQQQQQILKQQQKQQQHSTVVGGEAVGPSSNSNDSGNPLDQLLQQFEAAVAAGRQAAKQQQQPSKRKSGCGIQLLPAKAGTGDDDDAATDVRLPPLLPQPPKQSPAARHQRPLIQVLASSDNAVGDGDDGDGPV